MSLSIAQRLVLPESAYVRQLQLDVRRISAPIDVPLITYPLSA